MWSTIAKLRCVLRGRRHAEPPIASVGARGRRSARSADDLTVIDGIGPVIRDRLRILGIATFADLASVDPAWLAAQMRRHQPIGDARVQQWVDAATIMARARATAAGQPADLGDDRQSTER